MKTMFRMLFVIAALSIVPAMSNAQTFLAAEIHGENEVPAVTTSASGTGVFILDRDRTELAYEITVDGLSGPIAGAHFHKGAVGASGGVVRSITFEGNHASGAWKSTDASQPLTPELVADLLVGNLYVNVHTAANPGGEIRGQVYIEEGTPFTARLEGSQEVPGVSTSAMGLGFFVLNPAQTELEYHITVTGLSGAIAASHFHKGAMGSSGGVVKGITFMEGGTAEGMWTNSDASQLLTPELVADLLVGNLYVNVHTAANPGGEIRGQVTLVRTGEGGMTAVEAQTWARIKATFMK